MKIFLNKNRLEFDRIEEKSIGVQYCWRFDMIQESSDRDRN